MAHPVFFFLWFAPSAKGGIAALGVSVTEELARGCSSALAFIERHLAVDDDSLVPLGPLDPAPLAAREVVSDLPDPVRVDVQLVQIVHHYVSRRPLAQHAAIAEACSLSRQSR
jgi:hypothetical protein